MQIDKSLSFLDSYVHKSLEEGAEPYIPENERSGTLTLSNFGNQNPYESPGHSLRFEAYEVPKPTVPTKPPPTTSYPTELVPVHILESSYQPSVQPTPSVGPVSDAGSTELRLRLDGVQKKWGKPAYSSGASSSTASNYESYRTTVNGATQPDSVTSKPREPRVEVSEEKQKLAASLFGGKSARSEKEQSGSSAGHSKVSRTANHMEDKPRSTTTTTTTTTTTVVQPPPPDLLDLGEPTGATSHSSSVMDPFQQLEGLLDVSQDMAKPDLMSLYSDPPTNGQNPNLNLPTNDNDNDNVNPTNGSLNPIRTASLTKGPSLKDALDKDTLVRQMGVNPTTQNPNLFSDLL